MGKIDEWYNAAEEEYPPQIGYCDMGDIEADLLEEMQEQRETFNSDEEYIKWLNEYVKSDTQDTVHKIVVRMSDSYIKSIAK